ncbi:hypothetical protein RN001_001894 [Aquatica leii]|uniref:Uncharacterized protein n=1 Tax=Aquatica leii TaxID=1421715 RepID=A0AAN7PGN9_9COLE|nr:hypothetical protein RN001_001894 [Aquatica leii]
MAESEISDRSKSCKRCNKVPQTTVECIVCNSCFHPSCAKYTKNIIFIDDKYVNCCDLTSNNGELEQVRNTSEVDIYKIELKYLHKLLKQKDLVIKNQQIAIESLQNQILMINEYSKISKIHNNVDKDKDVRTFNVRDKNVTVSQHAVNKQNSSKGNNVKTNKNIDNQSCSLNTDASSNRKNTYSSVVMANDNSATVYANVNKPLNQEKKINDTLKTSKTSNLIVYGKNDAAEILGIQKNSFFFLTRVQPKNEVDDVIKFLTKNNINVVSCTNREGGHPAPVGIISSVTVEMAPTKTRKKGNKIAPWAPQWWSRGREHLPKIFITRGPKKPRPDEPTPPATVDSQINQLNQQMSRLLEETTTTTVASQVDRLSERMKQLFGETPPSSPTTYRGEEEAPLADELELPSPMQALPVDLEMPSALTLQAARTTIPKLDPTAPFFVSIPLERIFRSEVTAPKRPIPTPPPCHIPECTAVRKETSRP